VRVFGKPSANRERFGYCRGKSRVLGAPFAVGARACEASGVSNDRGAPPRLSEADLPAVTPLEFVATRGDGGQPSLGVREGELE
jgi:hypothetical protein